MPHYDKLHECVGCTEPSLPTYVLRGMEILKGGNLNSIVLLPFKRCLLCEKKPFQMGVGVQERK